jgi:extracellular factor (EF) 3-hydroxypalmitic acid methyl ester biosynthesis protein
MVNMILRDPHEGPSLFGKVLNRWFIKQPPAEAHRNRVLRLNQVLTAETLRAVSQGRPLRVFNVGCGPAGEIQAFLAHGSLADHAHFTLLDFNEETLKVARSVLEAARAAHGRSTPMEFIKKSVVQLLKGRSKVNESPAQRYDLVYCAGLFDYLEDALCKQLLNMFYDMVAPGGLLLVTNVDPSNPIKHWLVHILEWHLIYRDARQMLALRPDAASLEDTRANSDITGVNVFLEVRRPHA